jgi:hypothetical protein
MHRVPQAGPWWPAVGAPLERGVRQHIFATNPCVPLYLHGPILTCDGRVRNVPETYGFLRARATFPGNRSFNDGKRGNYFHRVPCSKFSLDSYAGFGVTVKPFEQFG